MKFKNHLNDYERVINLPTVLNVILFIMGMSGVLSLVTLYLNDASVGSMVSMALMVFLSLALYYLNKRHYHKIAGAGAFLLVSTVLGYNMVTYNGIYDVSILAFPALIVFSSLLLGYRAVLPVTATVVLILSAVYKLSVEQVVMPYQGRITTQSQDFVTILFAILISGALVYLIMTITAQNVNKVVRSEISLRRAYENTLQGWAKTLEMRDHETEGHSKRVTDLAVKLARKTGVPEGEIEAIRWGALLHDVGKMSIPDSILLKPGKLSEQEFKIIKEHPDAAKLLLERIPHLKEALIIPHFHHERWNGSGYPRGLKEKEIPLAARIFAVIDVWDALRSERPYKKAWSEEETRDYLQEQAGTLFDPNVVRAFKELLEEEQFPSSHDKL